MIAAPPDLLVIGGLTIDRFADGSTVAGGAVLHAASAAWLNGRRVATITVAGPEPEAAGAVAELAGFGPSLVSRAPASIRFAITESPRRRNLVLEAAGSPLHVEKTEIEAMRPAAVLLAPVAGELADMAVTAVHGVPVRVAALQSWLRSLVPGEVVHSLALDKIVLELSRALGALDALVASEDDLAAVGAPIVCLAAMRATFGAHPLLAVTGGEEGVWLALPAGRTHHVAPPLVVRDVSTVGAGDAFAALLAAGLATGQGPIVAASAAVEGVVRFLTARRDERPRA